MTIQKSMGMMASLPLIRGPGKGLRIVALSYPTEPIRVCTAHKVCLTRLRLERSCPEGRKLTR
ncbi:hypothetical protein DENIT_60622 [Pseudomonas veronii]|nr:hypothetical protein DENIT_60622 [Pseudomonas veronii]